MSDTLNIGIWFGATEGAHTEEQGEGAGTSITQAMKVPAGVKVSVAPGKPGAADFQIEIEGYRKDLPVLMDDILTQFESSLGDWNGLYGKTKKQHLADLNRAELVLGAFRVRS